MLQKLEILNPCAKPTLAYYLCDCAFIRVQGLKILHWYPKPDL